MLSSPILLNGARRGAWAACVLLGLGCLALGAGCGGAGGGYSPATVPASATARQSLERALTAWQKGQKPDALTSTEPKVNVVDSAWQAGQKLKGFTIVEERDDPDARRFAVKLDVSGPSAQKEVGYVVMGSGPLWVYRDEDYQRMVNMDNNPTVPAGQGGTRRR